MALHKQELQIWQKKLAQFGMEYAELENMLQQGFLENCETELRTIQEGLVALMELKNETEDFDLVFSKFIQVETLLKKVRLMRVNRLRWEKLILRTQKEKVLQQKKLDAIQKGKKSYYGKSFSTAFHCDETNVVQLSQSELPVILDMEDLAEQMKLKGKEIAGLIYNNHAGVHTHYNRFKIKANNKDGFQWVVRPKPVLKKAQDWIFANILSRIPVHQSAMVFQTSKSALSVMELHIDHELIIHLDLGDFYESIKFQRISRFFQAEGYSGKLANALALILTHNNATRDQLHGLTQHLIIKERSIPKGINTSKAMMNICCFKMDTLMQRLAQKYGLTYSRVEGRLILSHPNSEVDIDTILNLAIQIVQGEGFELQTDKTSVIRLKPTHTVTSSKEEKVAPSTTEGTSSGRRNYQNRMDDDTFDKVEEVDETRKVKYSHGRANQYMVRHNE